MTIKAIETRYKGYRFRSRLEARWAVFFDALGLDWEYEPEGYDLGKDGWYLPDFLLTVGGQDVWFEVKGKKATTIDLKKLESLCEGTGKAGFIASGTMDVPGVKVDRKGRVKIDGAKIFQRAPTGFITQRSENEQLNTQSKEIEEWSFCGFYEDGEGEVDIDHLYESDSDPKKNLISSDLSVILPKQLKFYEEIRAEAYKNGVSGAWFTRKFLEDGTWAMGMNFGSGRYYRSEKLKRAFRKARSARFEHGECG